MDIARELLRLIEPLGYTFGTDAFLGELPDDADGLWIQRVGGTLHNYTPIEESLLDIYMRQSTSQASVTALETIKRYIHRQYSTDTPSAYMYSILVLGDIEQVGRDNQGQQMYKLTMQILHRDRGVIS
jgi:hypothetical protein